MNVKVLQEDFVKAVNICSRFASSRVQLPVLANILIETTKNKLKVSATNLEISVSFSLGVKIEKEGGITVPSRILLDVVSNLRPGQIALKAEKEILEIKTADFESKITGMNSSDFPKVPDTVGKNAVKISISKFQSSLDKVLFSVSGDETRPVLTGVLMLLRENELLMVSTDGFRLSQEKLTVKGAGEEKRFIVPKGILTELARVQGGEELEFSYSKADNQVVFAGSNYVFSSRLIEGEFPDFEKIIPKDGKIKALLDSEEFLRLIKLASPFARDSANVIRFTLSDSVAEVSAESQKFGSQKGSFEAKTEGLAAKETFTIAFNYRFLEEFLASVNNSEIQAEFSDPNSPCLLTNPKDPDFFHIIMPVKL